MSGSVRLDAEPVRAVTGEHVELDERIGIEQEADALPRSELAPLVLAFDRGRAPRVQGLLSQLGQTFEPLLDGMGRRGRAGRLVAVQGLCLSLVLQVFLLGGHGKRR